MKNSMQIISKATACVFAASVLDFGSSVAQVMAIESHSEAHTDAKNDYDTRPYAKDAFEHYNRAVEFHQKGLYKEAIEDYKSAIRSDDRIVEAWSNLVGIYFVQKSYENAADAVKKELAVREKLRPSAANKLQIVREYGQLGLALCLTGNFAASEEAYKKALNLDEKTANSLTISIMEGYAQLLRKLSREPEAIKLEEQAKKLLNETSRRSKISAPSDIFFPPIQSDSYQYSYGGHKAIDDFMRGNSAVLNGYDKARLVR